MAGRSWTARQSRRRTISLPPKNSNKPPTVSREKIQKMLNLTVDLKQTRFYQEVFAEGQQEGEQEERQKEGGALILCLLQRRCGEFAPALSDRVQPHQRFVLAEQLCHIDAL